MIEAALQQASQGLLMPHPFAPFVWSGQAHALLTHAKLLELSGQPSDLRVTTTDLDDLLRNVAEPLDWHDAEQQRLVPRFQALKAVLHARLSDLTVYRVGAVQVQVYIIGRSGDDLAGFDRNVT